ncbi:hypothetical protein ABK040_001794 [Willaertia magna]
MSATMSHLCCNDKISKELGKFRISIPRTTFHATSAPEVFDPTDSDYWQGIGTLSLFGGIMLILALFILFFYDCFRTCGLFGGIEPTKGFFVSREIRKEPYGGTQKTIIRIFLVIFILLFCIFCGVLILGNVVFQQGFEKARKNFKFSTEKMANKTITIGMLLQNMSQNGYANNDPQTITTLQNYILQQQQIENLTSTLTTEIRQYNFIRYFILMLIAVLLLIIPLLGFSSSLLHWKDFAFYGFKLGYYLLIIVWLLFAIHFPFTLITQDVCYSVDNAITNNTFNQPKHPESLPIVTTAISVLQVITKCIHDGNFFEGIPLTYDNVYLMINDLNTQLTNGDNPLHRSFHLNIYNITNAEEIDYVKADPQRLSQVRQAVHKIKLFYYDYIPTYLNSNNCTDVGNAFVNVRDSGCVGMLAGLQILWITFLFTGFFLFGIIFVNCLSYKRFRKKRYVIPKKRVPEEMEIEYKTAVAAGNNLV